MEAWRGHIPFFCGGSLAIILPFVTFPTDSRQITNRTMADAFEPPAAHCAGCQRTDVQLLICDDCVEPPAGMSREEMSKKR